MRGLGKSYPALAKRLPAPAMGIRTFMIVYLEFIEDNCFCAGIQD
jgi:hypothetical protein